MTDTGTAAEAARIIAETEASREVTAQAPPDNPNPATDDARQRTDTASADPSSVVSSPSSETRPLKRVTASDRSRADIAARFREKRAAQGDQVEFHGDMRDPSQTYGPYAPQAQAGAAAEGGGVGVDATGAPNDPPPPPTPRHKGEGNRESVPAPPDAPRLVKVKVHGREAWLPEGDVIAEAQKSLAAGNLLESAKEVLAGARDQMTDDARQTTDGATADPSSSDPYVALAQTLQLENAEAAGTRLKQTIASETARARQEAAREAARQVRIETELAVSQRALASFESAHPELAADEFARDAVTTQVQREINADLQAAVSQGTSSNCRRRKTSATGCTRSCARSARRSARSAISSTRQGRNMRLGAEARRRSNQNSQIGTRKPRLPISGLRLPPHPRRPASSSPRLGRSAARTSPRNRPTAPRRPAPRPRPSSPRLNGAARP